jgi:hypothetical protein
MKLLEDHYNVSRLAKTMETMLKGLRSAGYLKDEVFKVNVSGSAVDNTLWVDVSFTPNTPVSFVTWDLVITPAPRVVKVSASRRL